MELRRARVGYLGICPRCLRPNQWIRLGRCSACRKGYTEAARTTADLKPKENSSDWVNGWKPLDERAVEQLEAQAKLGLVALEGDD